MNAITLPRFSQAIARSRPHDLFIFGDNLVRKGTGGQACIRYESNSWGIPTKQFPTMASTAFFYDATFQFNDVIFNLICLTRCADHFKTIIFPEAGLGTGLAKMPEKAPLTYSAMNRFINLYFDIKYGDES